MSVVYSRTEVVNNASRWDAVNDELAKIQTALTDALSRSGDTPNAMSASLDMGTNDIINVGSIYVDDLFVDGAQVPSLQDLSDNYTTYLANLNAVVSDADTQFNLYLTQAANAVTSAETAQTAAETAQGLAEDAQAAAEAAAAGVDLPTIVGGDAGKQLYVKADETGYELAFANANTAYTVGAAGDFTTVNEAVAWLQARGLTSEQVTLTVQDMAALDDSGTGTTLQGINGWLRLVTTGALSGAVTADPLITVVDSVIYLGAFSVTGTNIGTIMDLSHSDLHTRASVSFVTSTTSAPTLQTEASRVIVGDTYTLTVASTNTSDALLTEATEIVLCDTSVLSCVGSAYISDNSRVSGGKLVVAYSSGNDYGLQLAGSKVSVRQLEVTNNHGSQPTEYPIKLLYDSELTSYLTTSIDHTFATLTASTFVPVWLSGASKATFDGTFSMDDSGGTFTPDYHVAVLSGSITSLTTRSLITARIEGGAALTKNSFNGGECLWLSQ